MADLFLNRKTNNPMDLSSSEDCIKVSGIIKLNSGSFSICEDYLIIEQKIELKIYQNDKHVATNVFYCSPTYIKELVVGYLVSFDIISNFDDIKNLSISEDKSEAIVELRENIRKEIDDLEDDNIRFFNPNLIFESMQKNLSYSKLFSKTGGAHCIGFLDTNSYIKAFEDVGRHNALDKLIGHISIMKINPKDIAIITSGRLSQDMALKCINAGIKTIFTKSAPTSMAFELCKAHQITLVGFVRNSRLNIYNQGAYSKIINEDAIEMVFSEAKIDTKNRRYKVLKDTAIFLNR